MKNIRVASVQMQSEPGDKKANLDKVHRFLAAAAGQDVELAIFPECCITGYWFIRNLSEAQLTELAEPIPYGPSSERLRELAASYRIGVGCGLVEKATSGEFYNSYVLALPDGTIHRHRKLHAFEHPLVKSGSEFTTFDLQGWKIGMLICYDLNLFENSRLNALQGVDLMVAPHQTGGCRTRNPHLMGLIERSVWDARFENPEAIRAELVGDKGRGWLMRWLPSRAHDNGFFLVFSNGIGVDDDEIRTGNAMIFDPYGRILAETCKADDDMITADLDASLLQGSIGRTWIRARRPELYGPLAERTGMEADVHQLKFEE